MEGDALRRRRVSTPGLALIINDEAIDSEIHRLLSPPAKSVITTAPEEHEDQNNNQNSGHFCLHNFFTELAFLK
jgi:hypothetical protein